MGRNWCYLISGKIPRKQNYEMGILSERKKKNYKKKKRTLQTKNKEDTCI
jgi:hypothetical protein